MRGLVLIITCLAFPSLALADKNLNKDLVHIAFTVAERQVIERYFSDHNGSFHDNHANKHTKKHDKSHKKQKGLPPGLAKRQELPPGLAKRQHLPPGLAKKALPHDLVDQLPSLRDGLERAVIAGSIVLIETATGIVLDIIEDLYAGDFFSGEKLSGQKHQQV
jgi:hypothetical protein